MYLPYTEIGQQLADQLEKKDFSSQHRAKNSSFEINQQLADQFRCMVDTCNRNSSYKEDSSVKSKLPKDLLLSNLY